MAATVREAVRELLEQTIATMEALLDASDRELPRASSHACAQGKDLWPLITNDIDHEKIHTGQVLEGRYESRITASPMQRLIAEWLAERARLVGSLVGLTDEQFNAETAPGQWTYRVIAKHVLALEQDSLKTLAADRASRAAPDGVASPWRIGDSGRPARSARALRRHADRRDRVQHPAGHRRHAGVPVLLAHELDADRQATHRQQGHGHRRREEHRAGRIEDEIACR